MALDGGDAESVIAEFRALGIDDGALAEQLQKEGADAFAKSWKSLLGGIAKDFAAERSGFAVSDGRADMAELVALPAWQALVAHHGEIGSLHLRELFASDPGARRAAGRRGRGPVPRLLEEPHHRRNDAAPRRPRRSARPRQTDRGDVSRRRHQHDREAPALHVALRMPEGQQACARGVDVVAEVHAVSTA
jgi:hypothetical protein